LTVLSAAIVAIALAAWAIVLLVGPPQPPLFGPRLGFLEGMKPVYRVPEIEPFKPCDVYSYKSTLAVEKQRVEAELGNVFTSRSNDYDGYSWSSANNATGLEITIFPRREWKDRSGEHRSEKASDWVSVYVYYNPKTETRPKDFDPSLLYGEWAFGDEPDIFASRASFRDDGTYDWTSYESRRKRMVRASGTYSVQAGYLIQTQKSYRANTQKEEQNPESEPTLRSAITWVDRDHFRMGNPDRNQGTWRRVKISPPAFPR
jgi:hypothetical protein